MGTILIEKNLIKFIQTSIEVGVMKKRESNNRVNLEEVSGGDRSFESNSNFDKWDRLMFNDN